LMRARRSQFMPAVGVAPDGRVDVVYYDRHNDVADIRNEVSFQSSYDHGKSFSPPLRVSDKSFDSRIGYGSQRDLPQLGSRLSVLSTDAGALAVWTDTRGGTVETGKQDLARGVVAFSAKSVWRAPARLAGIGLVAAGAMVILVMLVPTRRKHTE
jgi:hypothetical protein